MPSWNAINFQYFSIKKKASNQQGTWLLFSCRSTSTENLKTVKNSIIWPLAITNLFQYHKNSLSLSVLFSICLLGQRLGLEPQPTGSTWSNGQSVETMAITAVSSRELLAWWEWVRLNSTGHRWFREWLCMTSSDLFTFTDIIWSSPSKSYHTLLRYQ